MQVTEGWAYCMQVTKGKNTDRHKARNTILEDKFQGFNIFLVDYLGEEFKACWKCLWIKEQLKPPFRELRSCLYEF